MAPAHRQDPVPQCACASLEAVETAREAFDLHLKRRLQEASETYTEALQLAHPRDANESEKAQILRFAPRLFVTPKEPFALKDAAAILHPSGAWIAYHLFWEDDIDFPDDNDPSDHEVIWVKLDQGRTAVAGVYTYFHGRIVQAPAPESPRPRIAVQWGKHGSMPWDWKGIPIEADESDARQTNGHPFTLEDYNRITWQKLSSIGRDSQGSPLGKGWPFKFDGKWEDFTRFVRPVDPVELLRKRGYIKVSCLNGAVINRHFLRYNFAAKTEWPQDLCSR
ncbi:MAG: hypothetical protein U0Q16_38030 [Bryobacteraceae bacterium]